MSAERRALADRLVDELRAATEEVLALVGPRSVALDRGTSFEAGRVNDEKDHNQWQSALERERNAWDAWITFTQDGPW
jgi:hypothetical protein